MSNNEKDNYIYTPYECEEYLNDLGYSNPYSVFESDPDYLNLGGYKVPFVRMNDGRIIASDNDWDVCEALNAFLQGKMHVSENQTWDAFNNAPASVAYRGGAGYLYTIYE